MPTQVHNRPSSAEPLTPPRTSLERHTSTPQDPTRHPSHDPRAKFNQHREALRLALGSILTPKRPSMPGSRSSSGTASPACSFSGSSGTYTPATPPSLPYTPSLDANPQEHPHPRVHYPHSHYHPTHPPSKLGRMEYYHDAPEGDISASMPLPSSLPKHSATPFGQPHPLVRSRSQNPTSRTSPRLSLQPATPPVLHTPPAFTTADSLDLGPSFSSPPSPTAVTSHDDDGGKINGGQMTQSVSTSGDSSGSTTAGTQVSTDGSTSRPQQQNGCDGGSTHGVGTPKAKFIQTLKGKSAWDALIHGSFS